MLATTHLIASLLLIQLMSLDRNDAFVALIFGVFIDVDHFFGLREYISSNGISSLANIQDLMHPEGQWKSLLHSPVAAVVVGQASVASRLAIPFIFWGTHLVMDYVQETFLGVFSTVEMAFFCSVIAALLLLRYRAFRVENPEGSVGAYFSFELALIRRMSRRLFPSLRDRAPSAALE